MTKRKLPYCRERFVRNGKLQMNLLRPAIEQYVRRWGYYDKETTCEFFAFVLELFQEDLGLTKKKTSKQSQKTSSLPNEPKVEPAKSTKEVEGGSETTELL
jgi:hypothetical protein